MGRCKSLGSLKPCLWCAPQLPGATMWCFHILSFLRAYHGEWLQSEDWLVGFFFFFPEYGRKYYISWASQTLQWWRVCMPMQGTQRKQVRSLGCKDPGQQTMAATSVSLPGKFHGKRSLGAYSPWGHKELHVTEFTHMHTHTHTFHFSRTSTVFIPQNLLTGPSSDCTHGKLGESCVCVCVCVCVLVTQSCLTLWDPMDYSPPGSSIHGILQARILEWVAISFSMGESYTFNDIHLTNPYRIPPIGQTHL